MMGPPNGTLLIDWTKSGGNSAEYVDKQKCGGIYRRSLNLSRVRSQSLRNNSGAFVLVANEVVASFDSNHLKAGFSQGHEELFARDDAKNCGEFALRQLLGLPEFMHGVSVALRPGRKIYFPT